MAFNEFAAKKLGEILAFNRVGADTLSAGREALLPVLSPEKVADMEETFRLHAESIIKISTDAGMIDTTLAKADKTEAKLKAMRELYIGDQWNNATEILEWSGFFEGAAIVHWALVRGIAEGANDETLLTFAEEGVNWHYELLETVESELSEVGADKGTV